MLQLIDQEQTHSSMDSKYIEIHNSSFADLFTKRANFEKLVINNSNAGR